MTNVEIEARVKEIITEEMGYKRGLSNKAHGRTKRAEVACRSNLLGPPSKEIIMDPNEPTIFSCDNSSDGFAWDEPNVYV